MENKFFSTPEGYTVLYLTKGIWYKTRWYQALKGATLSKTNPELELEKVVKGRNYFQEDLGDYIQLYEVKFIGEVQALKKPNIHEV